MFEIGILAAAVVLVMLANAAHDAARQRRRQQHLAAVEWAIWQNRMRREAAGYAARVEGVRR